MIYGHPNSYMYIYVLGDTQLCCAGKCLRSFHPKCLGLSNVAIDRIVRADAPFVCSDCSMCVQRCFSCRVFGLEEELVKCSVPFCGKFFHSSCLSKPAKGKKSAAKNNFGTEVVCPLHTCESCGETQTQAKKRSLMWRCLRCPKAYDLKHRPRDVHVLAAGIFLCIKHTLEEECWPELSEKLLERVKKRKPVNIPQSNIMVSRITLLEITAIPSLSILDCS
jgi:hypothetical protein